MLWLVEAASRWVWHATDSLGLRFAAAMISVSIAGVAIWRLGRRITGLFDRR